jgi:hypothetical protein
MAPLSFLHHGGRACRVWVMPGFRQVGRGRERERERKKTREKTFSSPAMRPRKKKRSVVQNGTVLCFCLLFKK